jgi:hypothetical protein
MASRHLVFYQCIRQLRCDEAEKSYITEIHDAGSIDIFG